VSCAEKKNNNNKIALNIIYISTYVRITKQIMRYLNRHFSAEAEAAAVAVKRAVFEILKELLIARRRDVCISV